MDGTQQRSVIVYTISVIHLPLRTGNRYMSESTSCKQLRCHYAAYCGLSVVCLVPFIGLRPHESSSLSRTARYTWLGRSRCSLCHHLLTACHSATLRGYCVILDILSFFALTSFLRHSVPAIMVAGKCTKRTTSSNLDKESVDERLR